ncbi:hypothetical protein BC830DRAFT_1129166 [Chytriomyces sp. MP71]|nr:hypothetical protein BC830DRAFT_1129166 [Chytriomyces sp. MP71]
MDPSYLITQYQGNDTDEIKMKLTIQIQNMLCSIASGEIKTNYYRLNVGAKLLQLLDEFHKGNNKTQKEHLPTFLLLWNLNFKCTRLLFNFTNHSSYSVTILFNSMSAQQLSLPFVASSSEFESISTLMNQRGCLPMTSFSADFLHKIPQICPFTIMTLSVLLRQMMVNYWLSPDDDS